MGYATACDLASTCSLDTALRIHLTSNHYPPVPVSMVGPCKRAIGYINKGQLDHNVRLPEGVSWRGKRTAPAYAIADAHHLDPWLRPAYGEGETYELGEDE
jgi:hypothetical protein